MLALLLSLLVTAASPHADLTGYYELDLPMGTVGLEVTRVDDELRAVFHRSGAPPAHARSVTAEDDVLEAVLLAHGSELRFRLAVTENRVAGRYTVDGGAATEFTGRKLERGPAPGG